jgi:hypothetical protein
MQPDEISTVERQHGTTFSGCKSQNLIVGNTLIGAIGGLNGEDIVAEGLQMGGGEIGKLFVSVEFCHGLSGLVFLDGLGNFYWIRGGVSPGVGEVGGVEAGIVGEDVGFGVAEMAGLHDHPNGDTGIGNPGIATTDAGCFFDACPGVTEALDEDLDCLGFFGGGEGEELGLEVLEWHGWR